MNIEVRHSIGTTNDQPPKGFESWIDYWDHKKPNTALTHCPQCDYFVSENFVGAHVEDLSGRNIYILPVCESCNNKAIKASSWPVTRLNEPFEVDSNLLVKIT